MTATSCSEVVLDLINKFEASLIDEDIATQLLAGIISETNSFQHVRTTPQTFLKASQLVSLGAKQQEIVSHLFKTKSLGLLKLWGRVLARLRQDFDNLLVYSAVNESDMAKAGASEEDASVIIKEMVSQLTFAKIFLFLKQEGPNQTAVFCHTQIPLNLGLIFDQFQPQDLSPQAVKFMVAEELGSAEKRVLDILRTEVGKVRGTIM
jgi:nanoRNase/pAp phosphatase (c-di-AMP/oligoRNAs hydrolase)